LATSLVSQTGRMNSHDIFISLNLEKKKMKITFALKILSGCLITVHVCAQNYYIDATLGNDNNSGKSSAQAWKSIGQVNSAIEEKSIKNGDKVLFKRNEIFKNTTLEIASLNKNSHSTRYTLFSAYGKGKKPIISYNTPQNIEDVVVDSQGRALAIDDSQYIKINNLEFQGGWASVHLFNSSNIRLSNLNIGKNSENGIVLQAQKSHINHHIVISRCSIINDFSFPYSYEDSIDVKSRTGDGFVAYAMTDSTISQNYFKNWGHASISLDADTYDLEIANNNITQNYLTSPDIAYGGRIGIDDAHQNQISDNRIIDTSVASQLNGYNNRYYNNIFIGTRIPPAPNQTNRAAVLIEAYASKDVFENTYQNNKIINSEGVGLKISDAGGMDIYQNTFKNNMISGCGIKEENKSIIVEENEEGASYSNNYINNQIYNVQEKTILYRGEQMNVRKFNKQKQHDDQVKRNWAFGL